MERIIYQDIIIKEDRHLWYMLKRHIVMSIAKNFFPVLSNLLILDIGCCTGKMLRLFDGHGTTVGLDKDMESLQYCRKNNVENVVMASAETLPFKNDTFDLITATDVIEHLDNDDFSLSETFRVIKRGGLLITIMPAFNCLWTRHDIESHHKRRYTAKMVKAKLEKAGFQVMKSKYINIVFFFPVFIISLIENITKSYFRKLRNSHSRIWGPLFAIISRLEICLFNSRIDFLPGVAVISVSVKK